MSFKFFSSIKFFKSSLLQKSNTRFPSLFHRSFATSAETTTTSTIKQPLSFGNLLKNTDEIATADDVPDRVYTIDNTFMDTLRQPDPNLEIYIIYLNRPFNFKVISVIHKLAYYTMMADGAANRFHDTFKSADYQDEIIPDSLIGDFDSIRQDVMKYYKARDVRIIHDHSQDDNDFEKCMRHLQQKFIEENRYSPDKQYKILITGSLGGRLDHTLNNIHILHKYAERYRKYENVTLQMMDNNSLGTCILPGKTIYMRSKEFEFDAGCGVFPLLGDKVELETKGLKWNISKATPMSFKDFVSSSNRMAEDIVEFETNSTLFWTTTNKITKKTER